MPEAAFLRDYRVLTLEDVEHQFVDMDMHARLMARREDWRKQGHDLSILEWTDGIQGVLAHPPHGDPPTLERLAEVYQRARSMTKLFEAPAVGGLQ